MAEAILSVVFGLLMLAYGADRFIQGAIYLSTNMRIPPMIIGIVVIGFATSAPEFLVSTIAALEAHPNLSVGNAVGSNIANIGMVLGVTAIVFPLQIKPSVLKVEYPLMTAGLIIATCVMLDLDITVFDGSILISSLFVLLFLMVFVTKKSTNDSHCVEQVNSEDQIALGGKIKKAIFWFLVGLVLLLVGAELLVDGAVFLARYFGATDVFIGLTIVAIGTSLPELAASLASAIKKETDLAIGNVIGSNLFNALGVLAMPAIIHPFSIDRTILWRDVGSMWFLTILLLALIGLKRKNSVLGRLGGAILLLSFFSYQTILFFG